MAATSSVSSLFWAVASRVIPPPRPVPAAPNACWRLPNVVERMVSANREHLDPAVRIRDGSRPCERGARAAKTRPPVPRPARAHLPIVVERSVCANRENLDTSVSVSCCCKLRNLPSEPAPAAPDACWRLPNVVERMVGANREHLDPAVRIRDGSLSCERGARTAKTWPPVPGPAGAHLPIVVERFVCADRENLDTPVAVRR